MNALSDVIVALWLIPVLIQIILPLSMLAGWGALKLVRRALFRVNEGEAESIPQRA